MTGNTEHQMLKMERTMSSSYTDHGSRRKEEPHVTKTRTTMLLAVVLSVVGVAVNAQGSLADSATTAADTTARIAKLGPRVVIGGSFTLVSPVRSHFPDRIPAFGIRSGVMIPIGSQVDLIAGGEYQLVPELTYSDLDYYRQFGLSYEQEVDVRVPASHIITVRLGVRCYVRRKKSDALVAAMGPGFRRLFWRYRVDRSGFHFGFFTGLGIGWHKRIIRTLPEEWTLNQTIPIAEIDQAEQPYTRWYWTIPAPEVGWTFNGRLDFSVGAGVVAYSTNAMGPTSDVASQAYASPMFTGCLALVIGRSGTRPGIE